MLELTGQTGLDRDFRLLEDMPVAPKIIIAMRHAEKPDDPDDFDLSPAGYARANALVAYVPATFGAPTHLFAAANSHHSHRPIETLQPLATTLGKSIHAEFEDDDYAGLADKLLTDAKYADAFILVCWHHEKIPKLLDALGAPAGTYSDPWPDDIFNLIVRLDYAGNAPAVTTIDEPF